MDAIGTNRRSIQELQAQLVTLQETETDLPSNDESSLRKGIRKLNGIREELIAHREAQDNSEAAQARVARIDKLLEKAEQQIAVHEQFLNNATALKLENILHSDSSSTFDFHMDDAESIKLESDDVRSRSASILSISSGGSAANVEIVRRGIMKRISQRWGTEQFRKNFGLPTALCIGTFFAIGTSRGVVVIFDHDEELRVVLGNVQTGADYGPVTCLDISSDQSRIVVGHQLGHIIFWDVAKARPIKTLNAGEKHDKGLGIVAVNFLHSANDVIAHDSQGVAYHHTLVKMMMVWTVNSTSLLSGKGAGSAIVNVSVLPTANNALAYLQLQDPTVKFKPIAGQVTSDGQWTPAPLPVLANASWRYTTDSRQIVCLMTPVKLLLVSLPEISLVYRYQRPKESVLTSLPCSTWRMPYKFEEQGEILPPTLAFSFGRFLHVVTVSIVTTMAAGQADKPVARVRVDKVIEKRMRFSISAIRWLSARVLAALSTREELYLIDCTTLEPVSTMISLREIQLVYHPHFSNLASKQASSTPTTPTAPTATGPRMFIFQQSFHVSQQSLFLLGLHSIHTCHITSWKERIATLVQQNEFAEAVQLGQRFYNGVDVAAAAGLPLRESERKDLVRQQLIDLVISCVAIGLLEFSPEEELTADLRDSFRSLAHLVIEACCATQLEEILFNNTAHGSSVYESFAEKGLSPLFFEVLETFIVNDRVSGYLTIEVVNELLEYYVAQNEMKTVEQIIVHLPSAIIPIDQMTKLCLKHHLYIAYIHIYTRALNDYITPMITLLTIIRRILDRKEKIADNVEDPQAAAGYIIFSFMSDVFTGKSYTRGLLSTQDALSAKTQLYRLLFSLTYHDRDPLKSDQGLPYPYMRILARFDARELTGVLSLAFKDSSMDGVIFLGGDDGDKVSPMMRNVLERQTVIDILLRVFTHTKNEFPDDIVEALYLFIARQLPEYPTFLQVDTPLLTRMFAFFTSLSSAPSPSPLLLTSSSGSSPSTPSSQRSFTQPPPSLAQEGQSRERQKALLDLLKVTYYTPSRQETEKLLALCERAGFYRVCEEIHQRNGNLDQIIACYTRDESRAQEVFQFIRDVLGPVQQETRRRDSVPVQQQRQYQSLSQEQAKAFRKAVITAIPELIRIDGANTAQVVLEYFAGDHENVLQQLQSAPKLQYKYLQGLLDPMKGGGRINFQSGNGNHSVDEAVGELGTPSIRFTELHERYIELMCQLEPNAVYPFLPTTENYRMDRVLALCEKYHVTDAMAWLLERMGDIPGALDLIRQALKDRMARVLTGTFESDRALQSALSKIQGVLKIAIQLCQRNSSRLESDQAEQLWFSLLDTLMVPHKELAQGVKGRSSTRVESEDWVNSITDAFRSSVQTVLGAMVGYVGLKKILDKIVKEQSQAKYAEYRDIIQGILETYDYEQLLLQTTNHIILADLFQSTTQLVRQKRRGYSPAVGRCNLCGLRLAGTEQAKLREPIAFFNCGHLYHNHCLDERQSAVVCPSCYTRSTERGRRSSQSQSESTESSSTTAVAATSSEDAEKATTEQVFDQQQLLSLARLKEVLGDSTRENLRSRLAADQMDDDDDDDYSRRRRKPSSLRPTNETLKLQLAPPPLPKARATMKARNPGRLPATPKFSGVIEL